MEQYRHVTIQPWDSTAMWQYSHGTVLPRDTTSMGKYCYGTRLRRTETKSREGCQEFRERSGCVESLSTMNGQFECQQDCSRVFLLLKEVFLSRIVVPWRLELQIFATKCLRTALSYATVVPHFIWCHVLHSYKHYFTIFAIAGNENRMGRSPDQFFPCGKKWSGNETTSAPPGVQWA